MSLWFQFKPKPLCPKQVSWYTGDMGSLPWVTPGTLWLVKTLLLGFQSYVCDVALCFCQRWLYSAALHPAHRRHYHVQIHQFARTIMVSSRLYVSSLLTVLRKPLSLNCLKARWQDNGVIGCVGIFMHGYWPWGRHICKAISETSELGSNKLYWKCFSLDEKFSICTWWMGLAGEMSTPRWHHHALSAVCLMRISQCQSSGLQRHKYFRRPVQGSINVISATHPTLTSKDLRAYAIWIIIWY